GGVFPKGIAIGEITLVKTPTGASHRVADVEPFVDFARLEHVIVLLQKPKDEPLVTPEPLLPATLRSAGAVLAAVAPRDGGVRDGATKPRVLKPLGPPPPPPGAQKRDGGEEDGQGARPPGVPAVLDAGLVG